MGLFDKKNKSSAGKRPKRKPARTKAGSSRSSNKLKKTADSVEQGFDTIDNGIHAGFEQAEKKVKKGRKVRKTKAKAEKSSGGFLSFLKRKKKKSAVGVDMEVDNQSDKGFDVSMHNIPKDKPTKKSLFGKKEATTSTFGKSRKKTMSTKSKIAGDSFLLKIFAVVLILLICGGVAALFMLESGTGGAISSNAHPAVRVSKQPEVSSEQVSQSTQYTDSVENANSEQPSTNTIASGAKPTVVEADSGTIDKTVHTEVTPENTEVKPEIKPAVQPTAKHAIQTKPEFVKEQPKPVKPEDKVNKPIALNSGKPQSESSNNSSQPVADLSYADFLDEASTTIYREE